MRSNMTNMQRMTSLKGVIFLFLLPVLVSFVIPSVALADDYYGCPEVVLEAEAQQDASLRVKEKRAFEFNGSFECVWWAFGKMPSSEMRLEVNGVYVEGEDWLGDQLAARDAEGDLVPLKEVPFDVEWRSFGGPDAEESVYSIDREENALYVFFASSVDESAEVTIDYTLTNFVQVYDDVAELSWRCVGGAWDTDSENVSLSLSLPAPGEGASIAGEDVHFWLHSYRSPLSVSEDIKSYSAEIPLVLSGSSLDMRAVFPSTWLADVPSGSPVLHEGKRLDAVLDEEALLEEQAQEEQRSANIRMAGMCVIPVAGMLLSVVCRRRYGKGNALSSNELRWREAPLKGLHPAAMLSVSDRATLSRAFAATLMRLSGRGVVELEEVPSGPDAYKLRRVSDWRRLVGGGDIDRIAVELLFDKAGNGGDSVTSVALKQYAKKNARDYGRMLDSWKRAVERECRSFGLISQKGKAIRLARIGFLVCSIFFVMLGAMFLFLPPGGMTREGITFVVLGIAASVFIVFVWKNPDALTSLGVEVRERAEALCIWIEGLGEEERDSLADADWREISEFACAMGVSGKMASVLGSRFPEVFEEGALRPTSSWFGPILSNMRQQDLASTNPIEAFIEAQDFASECISADRSSGNSAGGWSSGDYGGSSGGGAR